MDKSNMSRHDDDHEKLALFWDAQGVFIRPEETEAAFAARVSAMGEPRDDRLDALYRLYGFSPGWIDVAYSDKGIHFWEAGITWVDDEKDPPLIAIQLRRHFQDHKTLYAIYAKDEVLQHEYVHAARFLFQEPHKESKYDEHFSYATSLGRGFFASFRALLGPLFQASYEVVLLLFLLALLVTSAGFDLPKFALSLSVALGFYMMALVLRLVSRWRKWFLCCKHLSFLKERALHLMIRLSDEEVEYFASHSNSEVYEWIQGQNDFRFRFLKNQYL
jgi:hypothetical protein